MTKKQLVACLLSLIGLTFAGCNNSNSQDAMRICSGATFDSYRPTFIIDCPVRQTDNYIPVKYGCPPLGEGVSPPVKWEGIPKKATRLRIQIEDATCTYECNACCRFDHWILDLPIAELPEKGAISKTGIEEGASTSQMARMYSLPNTLGKKTYQPFCPPRIQTHAFIYQAIAYHEEDGKKVIDGRSQSIPFLYSLEHK